MSKQKEIMEASSHSLNGNLDMYKGLKEEQVTVLFCGLYPTWQASDQTLIRLVLLQSVVHAEIGKGQLTSWMDCYFWAFTSIKVNS